MVLGKNIIDLTLTINDKIKGVSILPDKTVDEDGWNASILQLYSHSETHMDAPLHFEVNTQSIDQLPVHRLISKAWVVDVTHMRPKDQITVENMGDVSQKIKKGDSVLLHTGWSKKLGTDEYRNGLPRISRELALWLSKKGINILGVEPPSIADVNNLEEVTEIHKILMENDIIIIEGLSNIEAISTSSVTLVALPLKVENGDGAPARVLALED
ncbi:cyclase family protein [Aquimarina aggregata]|uniref:cyclase family protein n=1 Tax=Aquimarina aggregata TaxID=1642818 RepID=UPI00249022A5|nr:cyclase family protein [Aquimarina aggregata]